MKVKFSDLEQAAMKLLKENIKLKKGEKIVLVTDRKKDSVFDAFKKAAKQFGIKPVVAKITSKRANSSPIPKIAGVMLDADVIIAPTTNSITHSPETIAAAKNGARVASMPGIVPELIVKAAKADIKKMNQISKAIASKLKNAKVINILTSSGTNMRFHLKGFKFSYDTGIIKKGTRSNIPFGEIFYFLKGGNGKIAIDYYGKMLNPKDSAWLEIRNGKIVKWNESANKFVEMLRKAGDCGLKTVELGIGTNPEHKEPIGNVLHDEKIYGSAHIAFGGGEGIRKCAIHSDVILMHPTIWVDGRKIMEKGKLIK